MELSEKGGETAFCQAGLKGYLTKGSMLVWINKYKNGSNRNDLHHAACPVIQGNKIGKIHNFINDFKNYKRILNLLGTTFYWYLT